MPGRILLEISLTECVAYDTLPLMTLPEKKTVEQILTPVGLQAAIEATGIRKTALAKKSGISRGHIYKYLQGETSLGSSNLKAIWDVLISK